MTQIQFNTTNLTVIYGLVIKCPVLRKHLALYPILCQNVILQQVRRIFTIILSLASLSRMSYPKNVLHANIDENERICCRNSNCGCKLDRRRTHVYGELQREPARSLIPILYNVRKRLVVVACLGQRCTTYDIISSEHFFKLSELHVVINR